MTVTEVDEAIREAPDMVQTLQAGERLQDLHSRPEPCHKCFCYWLALPELGDEWRPTTSKLIVCSESDGNRIAVHVDPGFPANWRKEPYYGQLKKMVSNRC